MQVNAQLLPKTGAKVLIALNGKINGLGCPFAVIGPGGSSDEYTLRVAGTIALKSGWTISVKFQTRDTNWVATVASTFSCHLLKTFIGCSDKQMALRLAPIFGFYDNNVSNTSASFRNDEAKDFLFQAKGGYSRVADTAGMRAWCGVVCVSAALTLALMGS